MTWWQWLLLALIFVVPLGLGLLLGRWFARREARPPAHVHSWGAWHADDGVWGGLTITTGPNVVLVDEGWSRVCQTCGTAERSGRALR